MSTSRTFSLTTPIYYVNARPHLGHTYTTVAADAIARRKRMLGLDVWFLTGTDEHGQKIERSARAANTSPKQFADQLSAEFRALWQRMGLTFDDFIRTTEPRHTRAVQQLFTQLKDRGYIYKGTYTGQYCVFDELYVDAAPGAPCPDCGRITETVNEENYFFKLSAFERTLLEYYERHPDFIRPEARRNEVISFVRSGLKDLSISRTGFTWGIAVPGSSEEKAKHVIYVWMDALANYITALGYGSEAPQDKARLAKFWPADLQLIGKEISRFHCVYWPAFLMAAGLPLPKAIVAHGWLLFEQSKMSKSRGNIVRAETILDVLGADALRYFLLREIVFGQDGSFSFDALVQRYNADLANGYGNLASRTLAMIEKYFDGKVPNGKPGAARIASLAQQTIATFHERFEAYDFSRALEAVWSLVAAVDGYITETTPWKLGALNDEVSRRLLSDILYTAAEAVRVITALVYPIIPDGAARIWQQLGLGDIAQASLTNLAWGQLTPGTKLGELGPVFPRAEKDAITQMQNIEEQNAVAKAAAADASATASNETVTPEPASTPASHVATAIAQQSSPQPAAVMEKPTNTPIAPETATGAAAQPQTISIDDFSKVELRVAQIIVAERIPKADKLLRLEVDLGYEKRQILAGIAEAYEPESLIGRKVVIVANLAPRKLRGLESNGMIVAASLGERGKPVLAGFLEDVEVGARLK
ncbi:MAG TPA: methionine--tRNA ligase [Acidobacteriaceae bacterium]|nr:methionine--tRNA ligase [Acidobacteriaceae bacterium]